MHSYKRMVLVVMIIYIFIRLYIPTIPVLVHPVRPKKLPIICFLFSKHILTPLLILLTPSILAMVTDALAAFYVVAPLSTDGTSSICITKPANTQEHLQTFQTFVNSPA